ncbi:DUF4232 domain-containing protein [Kribbella deserti]|uniref:DUF4232 domain-containing protein n=1 Tax=Kribbella deserti TaxID=1926257 RepID=A0ABV6QRN0_9ACTN
MRRPVIALALLFAVSACGTEVAPGAGGRPGAPTTSATAKTAKPTDGETSFGKERATPPPAKCPASGLLITRGEIDAAMGLRAITLTLHNCGKRAVDVQGYPVVTVLDKVRQPFKITVAPETPDGPPKKLRLTTKQTLTAELIWRNTVTLDTTDGPMQAAYLKVAPAANRPASLIELHETFGNTGKARVTPWARPKSQP